MRLHQGEQVRFELDLGTIVLAAQQWKKGQRLMAGERLRTSVHVPIFQFDSLHFAPNKRKSEPDARLPVDLTIWRLIMIGSGAVWQVLPESVLMQFEASSSEFKL
jgi:hypothetical protein